MHYVWYNILTSCLAWLNTNTAGGFSRDETCLWHAKGSKKIAIIFEDAFGIKKWTNRLGEINKQQVIARRSEILIWEMSKFDWSLFCSNRHSFISGENKNMTLVKVWLRQFIWVDSNSKNTCLHRLCMNTASDIVDQHNSRRSEVDWKSMLVLISASSVHAPSRATYSPQYRHTLSYIVTRLALLSLNKDDIFLKNRHLNLFH